MFNKPSFLTCTGSTGDKDVEMQAIKEEGGQEDVDNDKDDFNDIQKEIANKRMKKAFSIEVPDTTKIRNSIVKISGSINEGQKNFRRSLRKSTDTVFHSVQERSTSVISVNRVNKSKEKRLAYISLYIVWLFIFCHFWKLIPTAYEVIFRDDEVGLADFDWPKWIVVIEKTSHTLITINSSLNFLIYVVA